MPWVKRNEDKPHRCPKCHAAVVTWDKPRLAPKSVLKCPGSCGVKWRYGRRTWRYGMKWDRILNGHKVETLGWFLSFTTQRFGCLTDRKRSH